MQDQQNLKSLGSHGCSHGGRSYSDDEYDMHSPLFRADLQESAQSFQALERNGPFSNKIDFLAGQSFHTEPRDSLKIVPDAPQPEVAAKQDSDIASTLRSSQKSLIFEDQEDSQQNELELIINTEALTLRSQEGEMRSQEVEVETEMEKGRQSRSPAKSHKQKGQHIRQAKHLIRELRRQYKLNHQIMGDVTLDVEGKTDSFKAGSIHPIVSEKRVLSGLVIKDSKKDYKVKVVNRGIGHFDPVLQLWDESCESWREFSFKIKLLSD